MKNTVLSVIFLCLFFFSQGKTLAQQGGDLGKIALSAYVHPDEPIGVQTNKAIINRLNRILSTNGCAGYGFDSRFIATAHLQTIEESSTSTVPAMEVVELNVTIYVGDGENGTLFSSWNTTVKGVGESRDAACAAAVNKIPCRNPELLAAIERGKIKIVEYYNSVGPSIIAKAKACAAAGNYDEAISELIVIPASCNVFEQSQTLIGKYNQTSIDNANLRIIAEARAAWAASTDESGALNAEHILGTMDNPSPAILEKANALSNEIVTRMKAVSDREFNFQVRQAKWEHQLEVQRNQNETQVRIATAKAAAKVATAYYNSRPKIVHHVHWW